MAKLTPQELRHAKYSGLFATKAEELAELLENELPRDFPRIAPNSKRQMKDVELVAQLLLLTEKGIETYSQNDLDRSYGERDEDWEKGPDVEGEFRAVIKMIRDWSEDILAGEARRLKKSSRLLFAVWSYPESDSRGAVSRARRCHWQAELLHGTS